MKNWFWSTSTHDFLLLFFFIEWRRQGWSWYECGPGLAKRIYRKRGCCIYTRWWHPNKSSGSCPKLCEYKRNYNFFFFLIESVVRLLLRLYTKTLCIFELYFFTQILYLYVGVVGIKEIDTLCTYTQHHTDHSPSKLCEKRKAKFIHTRYIVFFFFDLENTQKITHLVWVKPQKKKTKQNENNTQNWRKKEKLLLLFISYRFINTMCILGYGFFLALL